MINGNRNRVKVHDLEPILKTEMVFCLLVRSQMIYHGHETRTRLRAEALPTPPKYRGYVGRVSAQARTRFFVLRLTIKIFTLCALRSAIS